MQTTLSLLALVATAFAIPAPQGSSAPAGCESSFNGQFEVTVVKPMSKRDLSKRQSTCGQEGILTLKLANGVLTDAQGRTGYIADNYQFQFDAPPQAGATVTSGFSVCQNSTDLQTLALSGTTTFYQCQSGSFYNLYNTNWAPQCSPVMIEVIPCPGSGATTPSVSATPGATITTGGGASSAPVATAAPDGQPQASSAAAAARPGTTVIPVAQLTDGQPNMPTALVSQLVDGQPQVTSAAPVVATTKAPTPVSQIGDGQPQAGNATVRATGAPSSSVRPFTGAAALPTAAAQLFMAAAGVAAVAMF